MAVALTLLSQFTIYLVPNSRSSSAHLLVFRPTHDHQRPAPARDGSLQTAYLHRLNPPNSSSQFPCPTICATHSTKAADQRYCSSTCPSPERSHPDASPPSQSHQSRCRPYSDRSSDSAGPAKQKAQQLDTAAKPPSKRQQEQRRKEEEELSPGGMHACLLAFEFWMMNKYT